MIITMMNMMEMMTSMVMAMIIAIVITLMIDDSNDDDGAIWKRLLRRDRFPRAFSPHKS